MPRKSLLLIAFVALALVAWIAQCRVRSVAAEPPAVKTAATEPMHAEVELAGEISSVAETSQRSEATREADRAETSMTIRGRVVDSQKQPIELFGLRVIHRDENNWFVGVDEQPPSSHPGGEFELTGLTGGRWEIVPFADGYALRSSPGVLAKSLEHRVDYVMRGIASVAGIVLDPDGNPVADADVEVLASRRGHHGAREEGDDDVKASAHVITAANGTFQIEVASGKRELVARANGWLDSAQVQIPLMPSEHRHDVELVLKRGATLRGTIVDSYGQALVGGWSIRCGESGSLEQGAQRVELGPEGRFEFTALREGVVELGLRAAGFGDGERSRFVASVEVQAGQPRDVALRLVERHPLRVAGRVTSSKRASWSAVVRPEPDGERFVPFESIRLDTDLTGGFEIVVPAPGRYRAWFDVHEGDGDAFDEHALVRHFDVGERDITDLVIEL